MRCKNPLCSADFYEQQKLAACLGVMRTSTIAYRWTRGYCNRCYQITLRNGAGTTMGLDVPNRTVPVRHDLAIIAKLRETLELAANIDQLLLNDPQFGHDIWRSSYLGSRAPTPALDSVLKLAAKEVGRLQLTLEDQLVLRWCWSTNSDWGTAYKLFNRSLADPDAKRLFSLLSGGGGTCQQLLVQAVNKINVVRSRSMSEMLRKKGVS
jgi:hypothetical protein